jgi:hypothetical protein
VCIEGAGSARWASCNSCVRACVWHLSSCKWGFQPESGQLALWTCRRDRAVHLVANSARVTGPQGAQGFAPNKREEGFTSGVCSRRYCWGVWGGACYPAKWAQLAATHYRKSEGLGGQSQWGIPCICSKCHKKFDVMLHYVDVMLHYVDVMLCCVDVTTLPDMRLGTHGSCALHPELCPLPWLPACPLVPLVVAAPHWVQYEPCMLPWPWLGDAVCAAHLVHCVARIFISVTHYMGGLLKVFLLKVDTIWLQGSQIQAMPHNMLMCRSLSPVATRSCNLI